jgi:hypothetical protein
MSKQYAMGLSWEVPSLKAEPHPFQPINFSVSAACFIIQLVTSKFLREES